MTDLNKGFFIVTFFIFAFGFSKMGVQNNKIDDVGHFNEMPLLVVLAIECS